MHAELRPGYVLEAGDVPFLSRGLDGEFDLPCGFVLNLATCWPEERGIALSSSIAALAVGCDVPVESLDLVTAIAEERGGTNPSDAASICLEQEGRATQRDAG